MENDRDPRAERVWESGWDGHERAQRRRLAHLSFADKLRWLEEAQETVAELRRNAADSAGRVAESGPEHQPPEESPGRPGTRPSDG